MPHQPITGCGSPGEDLKHQRPRPKPSPSAPDPERPGGVFTPIFAGRHIRSTTLCSRFNTFDCVKTRRPAHLVNCCNVWSNTRLWDDLGEAGQGEEDRETIQWIGFPANMNAMLGSEAGRLCGAGRYERSEGRNVGA